MDTNTPHFHLLEDGTRLAYRKRDGTSPTIVFLSGFMSDMEGSKATFLDEWCHANNYGFLRFDYFGHGASDGDFAKGTISGWLDNVLTMIDAHTHGPLILIGSSMGGWLMLQAARLRQERLAGLIGIAAAPDFTRELMWERFDDAQRKTITERGVLHIPSDYDAPYPITRALIEDGDSQRFFVHPPLDILCPVALLHGMQDADVPWNYALRIAEHVVHDQVQIHLIKDGDHRLSRPQDLQLLVQTIKTMTQFS